MTAAGHTIVISEEVCELAAARFDMDWHGRRVFTATERGFEEKFELVVEGPKYLLPWLDRLDFVSK